jgi:membrane-associated phospholipid phosphatase
MTQVFQRGWLLVFAVLAGVTPALAQSEPVSRPRCDAPPSLRQFFTGTLRDFRQLPSRDSLGIAALGGIAAIGAHSVDGNVTRIFSGQTSLDDTFKSGAVVGGTPFELGAAFATYAIGSALSKPCVASLGADLVRAQVIAEALTFTVKQATRRARPEGSGFSFPSGHATVAFASATVLQRHFGWKVGVPAYAVASYVAASRVEMKRHYLSDVAFGAALGIVAGRTVAVGHGNRLMLSPMVTSDGAGATFTWIGKK